LGQTTIVPWSAITVQVRAWRRLGLG
jgi:hypothetical protein